MLAKLFVPKLLSSKNFFRTYPKKIFRTYLKFYKISRHSKKKSTWFSQIYKKIFTTYKCFQKSLCFAPISQWFLPDRKNFGGTRAPPPMPPRPIRLWWCIENSQHVKKQKCSHCLEQACLQLVYSLFTAWYIAKANNKVIPTAPKII